MIKIALGIVMVLVLAYFGWLFVPMLSEMATPISTNPVVEAVSAWSTQVLLMPLAFLGASVFFAVAVAVIVLRKSGGGGPQ